MNLGIDLGTSNSAVVGADDEADSALLGLFDDFWIGREVAGDDQQADADLNRALLDVPAVADDDDGLLPCDVVALGVATEGADIHGSDAEVEILDAVGVAQVEDAGLQRAGDGCERTVDVAHLFHLLHVREEETAELEDGDGADEAVVGLDDGEGADVVMIDELEGFGAGGLRADLHDIGGHDVAHARGDVAQVKRERQVETGKDGVDTGVGVAAAGGNAGGVAVPVLVVGVADGGADRIGVGIAVADDVGGRGHEM